MGNKADEELKRARELYESARNFFFAVHVAFLDPETLENAIAGKRNKFNLDALVNYKKEVYLYFDLYLGEIFAEKVADLEVSYPKNVDDLSIKELQKKTEELQEKANRDNFYIFEMKSKSQNLYEDRLQSKIQTRVEKFKQLFEIDIRQGFGSFQVMVECNAQLTETQKDALHLAYIGATGEQKSILNKLQLSPEQLKETIKNIDGVLSTNGKAIDVQTLAGVCLLQLTTDNKSVLTAYNQYQKFAECAKNIDQQWQAYLTAKGAVLTSVQQNPSRAGTQPENASEITEQMKIDAVQRVRAPLNDPTLLANPLQKIKAFGDALQRPENRFLFKHRDDSSLANAGRGVLGFLGKKLGLSASTQSKSQQVASATWGMAMELEEARPSRPQQAESSASATQPIAESSAPRFGGRP